MRDLGSEDSGFGQGRRPAPITITAVQQKRGRRSPPFLAGPGVLPLLAALLLPALCSFLRHCAYPPLRVGFVREEHTPYRSASACRHSAVRQYAARRFVRASRGLAPRTLLTHIRPGSRCPKKSGVPGSQKKSGNQGGGVFAYGDGSAPVARPPRLVRKGSVFGRRPSAVCFS